METASRSPRATRENLKQALTVIDEIRVALEIPESTIQTATVLYRRLLDEEDKYYGWRIDDVAITAVFIACQMDDVPRESSEFTTIENHPIETKILFRRVKTVKEALDLEVSGNTNPALHIDRWEDDLSVSENVLEKAREIINKCRDAGVDSGKKPTGWAAAAVYAATQLDTDEKITQSELTQISDVSEVTIRNRYQEQLDFINKA